MPKISKKQQKAFVFDTICVSYCEISRQSASAGNECVIERKFLQITDARANARRLTGTMPSDAVRWLKIEPEQMPDTVVCHLDSMIAMPESVSFELARKKPRF